MWNQQLYFFILLFPVNGVFPENDTCFELISNQQSNTERFTTEQLHWICNTFIKWRKKPNAEKKPRLMKESKIGVNTEVLGTNSEKQKQDAWLNQIQGCRGENCLTNFVKCINDSCKEKKRACRKEIRIMSDAERYRFFAAVNQLKKQKVSGESKYDLLARCHGINISPGAHSGHAFLPFHREFLKQLEIALREVDFTVSLPYWDSTMDDGLPSPKDSILWTSSFFGNDNGSVTEGPFSYWNKSITIKSVNDNNTKLSRQVGRFESRLFKDEDIDYVLNQTKFANLQSSYSRKSFTNECIAYRVPSTFEIVHGMVHRFVDGDMGNIETATSE